MMKLNIDILKQFNACKEGIDYYININSPKTVEEAVNITISSNNWKYLRYSNWLLSKVFTKNQCVQYAVYSAKLVLHIFEDKFPEDKRPRLAIEEAENYLNDPSPENIEAAYSAAAAAYSAADTAAAAAAADAAAAAAADAAAYSAADAAAAAAAAAAADAADAAAAAADAAEILIKILKYGLTLIN